ncbi:3-carboxy-cis,cis-muconate cycloisomerase [Rhizobium helianthi]|uniref:3-carboxy-cis,cis-muconate cycloisomerase n=1 Tax=Rhizobium helianthi TaxID=1132695 RepID=A0ABW4M2G2_9HYPH
MSISAFTHPFLSGLLGDAETAQHLGVEADIAAMLRFEAALVMAEMKAGLVPEEIARKIAAISLSFEPPMQALREGVAKDGIVVATLVKQLKAAVGGEAAPFVHMGATSQDVIDTSLMLRLRSILPIFRSRLTTIISQLDDLDARFGERPLMGFTRMQAAIPIKVQNRIAAWQTPLKHSVRRLTPLESELPLQFGGAAGNLDQLGDKAAEVRRCLAQELGLGDEPQWHSQRDLIAEIANLLSVITGSLGKIGQDCALMAQMGKDIAMAGGGGSSAMAHKQNPVAAEALVALARFNAVQISGIHQSLVHEQERSGAAWTLEWLLLPNMLMACGASLLLAQKLLGQITSLGSDKPD